MKARMKLVPRTSSSIKMKTIFVYTAASIALFGVILSLTIVYLNLGNSENSMAGALVAGGSYTSRQNGNWIMSSTWNGGTAPPTSDLEGSVTINSNQSVTLSGTLTTKNNTIITINSNGKLTISGDLIAKNDLQIIVYGELVIGGDMEGENNSIITINNGGKVTTSGNIKFKNNTQLAVNGSLTVGEDLQFGNNATFNGGGQVSITGGTCDNWQGPGGCNDYITLPIELLSFTAENVAGGVMLTWKTATELNNDYFTIERSSNGIDYEDIATVKGSGTTKEIMSYEFTDTSPLNGRSYYRLTQTDFDGKFETFKPVAVEVELSQEPLLSVFPNPITGNIINVYFSKPEEGALELLDNRGNKILGEMTDGFSDNIQLALNTTLPPGLYYLKYKTANTSETIKLLKQPQ